MLILTGSNDAQQVDFHDQIAVGQKLLLFGAISDVRAPGASAEERAGYATLPAEAVIPVRVTNYRRWATSPVVAPPSEASPAIRDCETVFDRKSVMSGPGVSASTIEART